jgi:hypothetical protein
VGADELTEVERGPCGPRRRISRRLGVEAEDRRDGDDGEEDVEAVWGGSAVRKQAADWKGPDGGRMNVCGLASQHFGSAGPVRSSGPY